jgi:purine-cytosine permease-like protein
MAQPTTRRRFMELLVSVAVVHVMAIALYYALDVGNAPGRTQRIYAWIWMGVTVAVVLVGQQRLKRSRRTRPGINPRP